MEKKLMYIKHNGCQVEVLQTFEVNGIKKAFVVHTGYSKIDLGTLSVGGSVNCYGGDPVYTDPEEVEVAEIFDGFEETLSYDSLTEHLSEIVPIKAVLEARKEKQEIVNDKQKLETEKLTIKQDIKKLNTEKENIINENKKVNEEILKLRKLKDDLISLNTDLEKKIKENEVKVTNPTTDTVTNTIPEAITPEKQEVIDYLTKLLNESSYEHFSRTYLEDDSHNLFLIEYGEETKEHYQKCQFWLNNFYTITKNGQNVDVQVIILDDDKYDFREYQEIIFS